VRSVLLIFSFFCVVLVFCVEHANYYITDVVRLLMSIDSMTHVVSERKIFLKFGQSETRLTLQSEQNEESICS